MVTVPPVYHELGVSGAYNRRSDRPGDNNHRTGNELYFKTWPHEKNLALLTCCAMEKLLKALSANKHPEEMPPRFIT
jgi:hypothetical protein